MDGENVRIIKESTEGLGFSSSALSHFQIK